MAMASLRGGQQLWSGAAVTTGEVSPLVEVGPGPYVAFYIENTGGVNATFTVEAAASPSTEPGRNALDGTTDGGLWWGSYVKNGSVVTITVNAGSSGVLDLSPFGPQFVRIKRTDAGASTTISAIATSFGPN